MRIGYRATKTDYYSPCVFKLHVCVHSSYLFETKDTFTFSYYGPHDRRVQQSDTDGSNKSAGLLTSTGLQKLKPQEARQLQV